LLVVIPERETWMINLNITPHGFGSLLAAWFTYRVLGQRDLPRTLRSASWPTDADELEPGLQGLGVVACSTYSGGGEAIVRAGGAYGHVTLQRQMFSVSATGPAASIARFISDLQRRFERRRPPENDDEVWMGFWIRRTGGSGSLLGRRISVPRWDAVKANYPTSTSELLGRMMHWRRPEGAGQLLLFHGRPGTGKTWAIRALASEWRSWCAFEYVTDPERLFGPESDYLMDVLLGLPQDGSPFTDEEDEDDEDERPEDAGRWRVLVLEDTGEVLGADAKLQVGQALSRLLNVVDGLVGQGLRVLVLITTNEDLGKLHPAVIRPGRCLARVMFPEFDPEGARAWLGERGVTVADDHAMTLADLFAAAAGTEPHGEADRRIGFAPAST
jgi:hypothetical protein